MSEGPTYSLAMLEQMLGADVVGPAVNGHDPTEPQSALIDTNRNATLYKLGAAICDLGATEAEILALFVETNRVRVGPEKLDLAELRRIARNVAKYAKGLGADGERVPAEVDFAELCFTGERLRGIGLRPERPSPLPGLFPPDPHVIGLVAKPKVAKSALVSFLETRWAGAIAPWRDAPNLPGTRALLVTAEESLRDAHSTLARLAPPQAPRDWTDRVLLLAPDADLPEAAAPLLRLDERGLELFERGLQTARDQGDPIGLVGLDSLSRLKPPGVDENSADEMSAWLGALEAIAVRQSAWIVLVHHSGHNADPERKEANTAARGSSAISAVLRALWFLDRDPADPRRRVLKVMGNALPSTTITFRVAAEESEEWRVDFFEPEAPLGAFQPRDFVGETEEITTTALAWRLAGNALGQGRPPTKSFDLATRLRSEWLRRGAIEVRPGPKNSQLLRLRRREQIEALI